MQQNSRGLISLSTVLDNYIKKRGVSSMREEQDDLMVLEEGHSMGPAACCAAVDLAKIR